MPDPTVCVFSCCHTLLLRSLRRPSFLQRRASTGSSGRGWKNIWTGREHKTGERNKNKTRTEHVKEDSENGNETGWVCRKAKLWSACELQIQGIKTNVRILTAFIWKIFKKYVNEVCSWALSWYQRQASNGQVRSHASFNLSFRFPSFPLRPSTTHDSLLLWSVLMFLFISCVPQNQGGRYWNTRLTLSFVLLKNELQVTRAALIFYGMFNTWSGDQLHDNILPASCFWFILWRRQLCRVYPRFLISGAKI